jgi:adenosylcobyric acid synthase
VAEPSRLADADLVVLPGSKATVADLAWLRSTGLADAVTRHAAAGRPVLGICGGYQMLGRRLHDPHGVEAAPGTVEGLGLLDVEVTFDVAKHLATPTGTWLGEPVAFYEIHHGRERRGGGAPLITVADGTPEGVDAGHVLGTHAHGLLENDGLRRRLLVRAAAAAARDFTPAPDTRYAAVRAAQLDLLGDLVETHLDTAALERLITDGAPAGLPTVRTTAGQARSTS